MTTRQYLPAFIAAAGALIAALSCSSAIASADVWTIGPATEIGAPLPDVVSVSGMPPFDQSLLEQGEFAVTDINAGSTFTTFTAGVLSTTESFGMTNEDFVSSDPTSPFPDHGVVDILSVGGYENVYVDLPGTGAGGANAITDTLVTPFGNFDIPVSFDAAAIDVALSGASVNVADLLDPSGWAAALDADWATLVADFSALF